MLDLTAGGRVDIAGQNVYCIPGGDSDRVGNYPTGASPYGALDMAGNAWEWVNDWHQSDYYSISPYTNPMGPLAGTVKIFRGGSFYYNTLYIRTVYCDIHTPDSHLFISFRSALPNP